MNIFIKTNSARGAGSSSFIISQIGGTCCKFLNLLLQQAMGIGFLCSRRLKILLCVETDGHLLLSRSNLWRGVARTCYLSQLDKISISAVYLSQSPLYVVSEVSN